MNLSCGIVGLPNVGKSTLFNALLARQIANVSNYPFCTIEPNIGVVAVPDYRLAKLAGVVKTEKIVPAIVKFVDIAGLVKDANRGEGLGNKFLSHIREVNAVIHVLRAFNNDNIVRSGSVDPRSDLKTIETELCLADLQTMEKQQGPKGNVGKKELVRWEGIKKLRAGLEQGISARDISLAEDEVAETADLALLTSKKVLVVLNISESDVPRIDTLIQEYKDLDPIPICAKVEAELAELGEDSKREYLASLGLTKSGLESLILKAFDTLGLMTFLTAGEKEVRAWTIKKATKAPRAAAEIHTDFEKGFVRAQVTDYQTFIDLNGWKGVKEAGKARFEGKDYVMQEGDVVEFLISG
ncbi:redox-regulated ATPase YchF [candidate division WWE3 bacterium CG08_land_8_20_14_0_20_41_15]|uniref:Ribosome-binding ATPase YchF n=1 Tax=candidate division WWE3 bacterium CG08_land_8_20_14_0_20_41_15 TaxID=1975086 RepID=A0A2H0XBZ3_UNCKA|nr:MAG: redox-regulated ATPase YchF [candidate division WWE3 bacterium CG08_land_8_20_14_0_20_41_15]